VLSDRSIASAKPHVANLPFAEVFEHAIGPVTVRISAPTRPRAVQTILGHKERTAISSGSPSAFMIAL
jgi:hypothetical protein